MYTRTIQQVIEKNLFKGKVIVIYGARQVGKTTLLEKLFDKKEQALILNCERPEVFRILESFSITEMKLLFKNKEVIALDEAQVIPQIGKILKVLYDSHDFPQKLIATGSSSLNLSSIVTEPLTGRHQVYTLFPLLLEEIIEKKSWLWIKENLEELLLFGTYPGIMDQALSNKANMLLQLSGDYLFKDILSLDSVKNSAILRKLLQLLALQIGSQVSLNELAQQLSISLKTVERYIDLLEKSFVLFSLPSYNKNLRNELKKSKKYYFYDLGIRNALINNFSAIETRYDKGALWENFCVSERYKRNKTFQNRINMFFWRTYDGAEIDIVEEKDGKISCFECKFNPNKKSKFPQSFLNEYTPAEAKVLSVDNFHEALL
ncbi:MAG TPA: ATP-binding protein [Prolixibacteraceae bacterium]|nr:ATP-binding protein [Prolixibacteraceae bacterium]